MKVFITGGAGFIGSNIANYLIKDPENTVVALDNEFLGTHKNLHKDVIYIQQDIRDRKELRKLCQKYNFDYIVHLASLSSVGMYYPDPTKGLDVAVHGMINVLECAKEFNIKKIVYASTSSLYSRTVPPHSEQKDIKIGSFYELGKLTQEELARLYYEQYGVKSIGLRYFAVYGPNELHKGHFANNISQFLWSMLDGESPILYGDGVQTRDFTYIDDAVNGTILALRSNYQGSLNIGTGRAYSFNEIIEIINETVGTKITPKYIPNPLKNYVRDTLADIKLAKKEIDYVPKISVREGIHKLVKYYVGKQNN